MAEVVLRAEAFGYRYPERDQPALDDVDLELEAGSFTVLAGRSASSKSTLLRAASGLVPHFHGGEAWGNLTVGGMSVRDHEPGDIARVAGTVLQEPEAQLVMNTVSSIITFCMVFVIQSSQNRDSRALQLKLDEIIRTTRGARNELINLETAPEERVNERPPHY